ncbi:MAG: tetratricopeptide repeat protein [Pseudomonadota bacterium]
MKKLLKSVATATILSLGLAGCTATTITAHTSVIDHQDSGIASGRSGRADENGRGNLRLPKSDHVSLKGNASNSLLELGKEHFKERNYGLAEENFRKAVETRSDDANAWLGLAASLDQLGRFEFADRAYAQLVKLKKNNARVYNNIGYSHLLRGDYSKARQYFNRAQNIDPSLEEIQGNIHLLEKTLNS